MGARGYTETFLGQYEKAIADYEQALKLNPNDIDTPQRLLYARGQLAARNAPPPTPTPATPTPTPEAPGLITPLEHWDRGCRADHYRAGALDHARKTGSLRGQNQDPVGTREVSASCRHRGSSRETWNLHGKKFL